jgi:hypothetical protein
MAACAAGGHFVAGTPIFGERETLGLALLRAYF